jgi:transposase|tara:strand:- start:70 stop:1497 length:1428 start_codon:yes stop_codon:yes gene_type:complete
MDKSQAEVLYDSGKEPTVEKLLEYDEEVKELKERIAKLESDSQDSSKPPSSDNPQQRDKRKQTGDRKKSGRKPGGQPGHKGSNRELIPVEEVTEVIGCYAEVCESCKCFTECKKNHVLGEPLRWQQVELPPIEPEVIEYQVFTLCGKCREAHQGCLPPEVAMSNFGARLTAMVGYFTAVLHVSRRMVKECFETLLGVRLALGSIQNLLEQTSEALQPMDKELKDALPKEAVLGADETGWNKRWLWIFVAESFMYFHVAKSRASVVLKEILGEVYHGILCVDRWGAYTKYHKGKLQICWAHLKRNFEGIKKLGEKLACTEIVAFATEMESLRKRLMKLWYRFKEGDIDRSQLIEKSKHIRYKIKRCLEAGQDSEQKTLKRFATKLLKLYKHLFTFIFHEGVDPTNNFSERGIRPAVQWRKVCFGNRSDAGAVLTSRLLTATRTCWLKKRNALEFLVSTIIAYRKSLPAPSLLEQSS